MTTDPISLEPLLPQDLDGRQCKLHFAVFNGESHPIDALGNDPEHWRRGNTWRNANDDFNRRYIFSLAQDRDDPTLWLFGGIWEVLDRRSEPRSHSHDIFLRTDLMGPFIRRLFVRVALAGRNRRRNMESCLSSMTVAMIAEDPYEGEPFPGHDRINHSLAEIQTIIKQRRPDWRVA